MPDEIERKNIGKKPVSDTEIEAESLRSAKPVVSRSISGQPAAVKMIAKHTVGPDDTLSSIALKFYKNAGQKFYMAIYEANKAAIGDNPNRLRVGTVLDIPEAPKD